MSQTVFFSWQADTPNRVNRTFIRAVLDEACAMIASDANVDEALRDVTVDSDTQGVAGQPPIVDTIFKKIDGSAVVVADMTFVGSRTDGRPTPNPNVLIEYGWALKGLGHERVIYIMNTAYGEPNKDNLPFDLSHLRWPICYSLPENATPDAKAKEKRKLLKTISEALRISLATIPKMPTLPEPKFPEAKAKDGPARFRAKGDPLGFENDFVGSNSNKEVFLSQGAAMWFRLTPLIAHGKSWPTHELKELAMKGSNLMPLIHPDGGYSYLRAEDGIGMYRAVSKSEKDPNADSISIDSVAFAFETGEVWSIETAYLAWDTDKLFSVEEYYVDGIRNYSRLLSSLGLQPPYRWVAGITGVKGRYLQYPVQQGYSRIGPGPRCAADTIEAEGQWDGKQSATTALLPFFKKIFDKCGLPRPDYLPQ